jgi:hypothetical protein
LHIPTLIIFILVFVLIIFILIFMKSLEDPASVDIWALPLLLPAILDPQCQGEVHESRIRHRLRKPTRHLLPTTGRCAAIGRRNATCAAIGRRTATTCDAIGRQSTTKVVTTKVRSKKPQWYLNELIHPTNVSPTTLAFAATLARRNKQRACEEGQETRPLLGHYY